MPLQEKPTVLVAPTYVPPGVPYRVKTGETWIGVAKANGLDPWTLIDFNFPGTKNAMAKNFQRGTRQVNWYLSNYVGCHKPSHDGWSWAFSAGATAGLGAWKGGVIWLPKKLVSSATPIKDATASAPTNFCSARRPEMYRLLDHWERQFFTEVFGPTLPPWDQIAIGNGVGMGGAPWTSDGFFLSGAGDPGAPNAQYVINVGNVAWGNLTASDETSAILCGNYGRVNELMVHEMTHVWQMYNESSHVMIRSFYAQTLGAKYKVTPGDTWDSYNVEQQATIVEDWFRSRSEKSARAEMLYPYVRLVLRSGQIDYPRTLTLAELGSDMARLPAGTR